ncbi:hypothetical protein FB45DRAFT_881013 [Roridomyces roridus]|uniref:Uncharacterized protein n=1 Tax=Roridomyces roridus TaxID=1738132 RepID=A0AAD7AYA3_9AGAR|nr:hypothetical protein FB45DRAFT_880997 [Roridomyces roridus]KAJ7604071.1 hypothetical protein FB45DRAFT_881004 [Roridomyces roridus]KAJ7604083.1 hypothetical protein FB45DRAFT_881013 [Roridomyces roridus]
MPPVESVLCGTTGPARIVRGGSACIKRGNVEYGRRRLRGGAENQRVENAVRFAETAEMGCRAREVECNSTGRKYRVSRMLGEYQGVREKESVTYRNYAHGAFLEREEDGVCVRRDSEETHRGRREGFWGVAKEGADSRTPQRPDGPNAHAMVRPATGPGGASAREKEWRIGVVKRGLPANGVILVTGWVRACRCRRRGKDKVRPGARVVGGREGMRRQRRWASESRRHCGDFIEVG